MEETLEYDCGIAYGRLASWLDGRARPHGPEGVHWEFDTESGPCCVELEPLGSRSHGRLELERTRLVARGAPEAIAAFERLFTLQFLSAGG